MEMCMTYGTEGLRCASTYWFWIPQQRIWAPPKRSSSSPYRPGEIRKYTSQNHRSSL